MYLINLFLNVCNFIYARTENYHYAGKLRIVDFQVKLSFQVAKYFIKINTLFIKMGVRLIHICIYNMCIYLYYIFDKLK